MTKTMNITMMSIIATSVKNVIRIARGGDMGIRDQNHEATFQNPYKKNYNK